MWDIHDGPVPKVPDIALIVSSGPYTSREIDNSFDEEQKKSNHDQ